MSGHSNNLLQVELPRSFGLVLRDGAGGPELAREPVRPADLGDVAGETWLHTCLRGGFPELPLSALPLRVLLRRTPGGRCDGFDLEAALPDGGRPRRSFSTLSLSAVARRAAQTLPPREQGHNGDLRCELAGEAEPEFAWCAPGPLPSGNFTSAGVAVRTPPLHFLRAPLAPLQATARAVGDLSVDDLPVFITAVALQRLLRVALRGMRAAAPTEWGGLLLGSLAWCAQDFYVVVADALELEGESTQFSLEFSGGGWARAMAMLSERQRVQPEAAWRLLGVYHGHPFRPMDGVEGGCERCPKQVSCSLHSAFMSAEDHAFVHATFRRVPWALSAVVGLTPRRTVVTQLFGLRDGRWQPRGFYLLPDEEGLPWAKNLHSPH